MIISLVSLKGGAGKSTLSINLAVAYANAGAKVILVDSDPNQRSCLKWSGQRPEERPQVTTVSLCEPDALRANINAVHDSCDVVIIDGTPALSELTGTIMLVSDLVLVPLRSSDFDAWAFNDHFLPTLKHVRALKKIDCRVVRNALRKKSVIGREVLELLEQYDLPVLHRTVGLRIVFENTPRTGLGVVELDDAEAKFEIEMLHQECEQILTNKMTEAWHKKKHWQKPWILRR